MACTQYLNNNSSASVTEQSVVSHDSAVGDEDGEPIVIDNSGMPKNTQGKMNRKIQQVLNSIKPTHKIQNSENMELRHRTVTAHDPLQIPT